MDPDKVNNDVTAKDTMNEDDRGDVTGVIVIGSEIRKTVMCHIPQNLLGIHGDEAMNDNI